MPVNRKQLAGLIDHTLVQAYATQLDIDELCDEAAQSGFRAIVVNPVWVPYAVQRVAGRGLRVAACIGFPLGATTAHVKLEEAREAVQHGASELDVVINLGAVKSGYADYVERELLSVIRGVPNVPVTAVLEMSFFTEEEAQKAAAAALRAGAECLQTSTGYGDDGATPENVKLLRAVAGPSRSIKAAGGVRTYADVAAFLEAGADRVGTSTGVSILEEFDAAITARSADLQFEP